MKLKDKIKSYSFWVSLASAVILILKVLGNRFGFTVDETMVSDIFTALCSILVLLGIIVVPSQQSQKNDGVKVETQYETTKPNEQEAKTEIMPEKAEESIPVTEIIEPKIEPETKEDKQTIQIIEVQPQIQELPQETTIQNEVNEQKTNSINFKELFENEREKFAGHFEDYLMYLQEEIKTIREKM